VELLERFVVIFQLHESQHALEMVRDLVNARFDLLR
jgi:hypothetical protein